MSQFSCAFCASSSSQIHPMMPCQVRTDCSRSPPLQALPYYALPSLPICRRSRGSGKCPPFVPLSQHSLCPLRHVHPAARGSSRRMASVTSFVECVFGFCFGTSILLLSRPPPPTPPWEQCMCESAGPITLLYHDNSDWLTDVHVIGDGPIRALPWNFSIFS